MNSEDQIISKLVEWHNDHKLAVFIGAGVSRLKPIGCLGWEELAKKLVQKCYTPNDEKNNEHSINFQAMDSLNKYSDHRMIITMCYHFLKTIDDELFFTCMAEALKENEKEKYYNSDIYSELWKLKIPFITTNADTHFDKYFNKENIKYKLNDFNTKDIIEKKNCLFKIHGSFSDKKDMVFTVDKYFERYTDPNFKIFINELFSKYHILFIGYSLTELELLYPLFEVKKNIESNSHIMFKDYFKYEDDLIKFEKSYYNTFGVTIYPYFKDEIGFDELKKRIEALVKYILTQSITFYKEIDEIINDCTPEKANRVFQLIKNNPILERYFFYNLSRSIQMENWLNTLFERGYLEPENNLKKGQSDFFPIWYILVFLIDIAKKIPNKEVDEQIISKICNFVDSFIKYEKTNKIGNPYSNNDILEIICFLPSEKITVKHIDFISDVLKEQKKEYD